MTHYPVLGATAMKEPSRSERDRADQPELEQEQHMLRPGPRFTIHMRCGRPFPNCFCRELTTPRAFRYR